MTREELISSVEYHQVQIDVERWRNRSKKRTLIRKLMSFIHQYGTDKEMHKICFPQFYKKK